MARMLLVLVQVFHILAPSAVVSAPAVYDQRQTGNSNIRINVKDAVLVAIAEELGDYDYSYDYADLTIKPENPSTTTAKPASATPSTTYSLSTSPPPTTSSTGTSPPPTTSSTSASLPPKTSSPSTSPPPKTSPAPSATADSVTPANASIIIDSDNSTLTFVSKPGNESSDPTKVSVIHAPIIGQDYQIPVIVLHGDPKETTKLLPVKIVEKSAPRGTTEESPQLRHCSPGFFLDSYNRCKRIRKAPLRESQSHPSSSTPGTTS